MSVRFMAKRSHCTGTQIRENAKSGGFGQENVRSFKILPASYATLAATGASFAASSSNGT